MKLQRFRCRELNGYLNFDIKFNTDITFLIGINGSGKTSILKATIALISPDIDWLMTAKYKTINLELAQGNQNITIIAEKNNGTLKFTFADGNVTLTSELAEEQYQRVVRRQDEFFHDEDGNIVRLRESRTELPNEPAFEAVRNVPNPIFLGIDRTTLPVSGNVTRRGPRRPLSTRRPHATLRAFLDDSVAQAEDLAVEAIRKVHSHRLRLAAQLRDDVLLTLFSTVENVDVASVPSKKQITKYERMRSSLKDAFRVIGIDQRRVDDAIEPYFERVIAAATRLSSVRSPEKIFEEGEQSGLREVFFSWMEMSPRLQLFSLVEDLVNRFNERNSSLFSEVTKYIDLLKSFFADSGKVIYFGEDASLGITLSTGRPADVYCLSSGERQIFVLITTLMFGDPDRGANVLIIDEPELSLHIKWQEMFVDALIQADPNIQLILATHSPSIIRDRDASCVDL